MSSYANYFEERGIDYEDFNVRELGSLFPFGDVFPRARFILPARVYEYFSEHNDYEFLPLHLHLYRDGDRPDSYSLIWVCRYCMFDPLIMDRHLCVDCMAIPIAIRNQDFSPSNCLREVVRSYAAVI